MLYNKLLLLYQPTEILDIPSYTYLYPPNGLISLYSFLKPVESETGFTIDLVDMYDKTEKDIYDAIEKYKPALVGLGMLTPSYKSTFEICKKIKSRFPEIKIILGGIHPTLFPEKTLAQDCVDFVIVGEGELSLYEFLKAYSHKQDLNAVPSLGYKQNGQLIINRINRNLIDLNQIDMLDFDCLDIEKYIKYSNEKSGYRSLGILASRGCHFNCAFCVDGYHESFIRKWRAIEPQRLVEHIKEYKTKYKIEGIWLKDSTFSANRKWIIEFCNELINQNVNIQWSCNTRVDCVDEERLDLMKRAGCETIWFGVESGSKRILSLLNKKTNTEGVIEAFKLCEKYKIRAWGNFMIGVPTETIEDIKATYELAVKLQQLSNVDNIHLTVYTPFPGTPLYEKFCEPDFIFKISNEGLTYEKACVDTGEVKKEVIQVIYDDLCEYFYKNKNKSLDFSKYELLNK